MLRLHLSETQFQVYIFPIRRYGRRPILIASLLLGGICGIIKSFSVNYEMFATFEFLTAFVSGGAYMTIFIMAIESAGPTKRVFGGTLISFMFSFSQVLAGFVAMMVPNFRTLLLVLYVPNLLMLTFVWMVPESVRWLLVNGKVDEAKSVLRKQANMNKITFAEGLLNRLDQYHFESVGEPNSDNPPNTKTSDTILSVLQSRVLAIRLVVNVLLWFLIKLIYFGMTIQSVALAGDKYVNFILVSGIELPTYLVSSLLMQWIGRKWSLFGSLLLTGTACVAAEFIPKAASIWVLLVYLFGKGCATVAFSVLYVYSTEQFPTSLRHSTMNVCFSIGSMGSIIAPFTMLLVNTYR